MRRKEVSARKAGGPLAASGTTKLSPHLGSPTFLKLSAGGDMRRAARAVSTTWMFVRGPRRAWTQLSRSRGERHYRPSRPHHQRAAGRCRL